TTLFRSKSTDDRIKNQSIIEAPVIVYYDAPQFPIQALSSLDRRTHWISIQCYRQATESLSAFRDRVNSQVNSISHAGFYQLPTWNFYTLNGTVSEEFITDTFQFIRPLFDDYKVIGLLAFADMRPTGMVDNPRIAAFFEELEDAVLDAPNRYTGWMSRFTNPDEQLKNILSQDKAQFVLSKEQTDYIKSFLGSEPAPPTAELPNEFAVVQDIYQKWKPLTSEIHAHLFVRDVAATLRMKDKNWGMITKNPGENQCT